MLNCRGRSTNMTEAYYTGRMPLTSDYHHTTDVWPWSRDEVKGLAFVEGGKLEYPEKNPPPVSKHMKSVQGNH